MAKPVCVTLGPLPTIQIAISSYFVDGRVSDCTTLNGDTLKFYVGHSRLSGVKELEKITFGFTYRMTRQEKAKIGDCFVMKVWPPDMKRINNSGLKPSEHDEDYTHGYA